jgi:hypothetical protein
MDNTTSGNHRTHTQIREKSILFFSSSSSFLPLSTLLSAIRGSTLLGW